MCFWPSSSIIHDRIDPGNELEKQNHDTSLLIRQVSWQIVRWTVKFIDVDEFSVRVPPDPLSSFVSEFDMHRLDNRVSAFTVSNLCETSIFVTYS